MAVRNLPPGIEPSIETDQGTLWYNPYTGQYTKLSRNYALRLQRAWKRGETLTQARRGGGITTGAQEYAQRIFRRREKLEREEAQRELERQEAIQREYSLARYQAEQDFRDTNGFSYSYWEYLRENWIIAINNMAWPSAPTEAMHFDVHGNRKDPRIFPSDVRSVKRLYDQGFRDPVYDAPTWQQWVEARLAERLSAMQQFRDTGDNLVGKRQYESREMWISQTGFANAAAPPIEWWWYH